MHWGFFVCLGLGGHFNRGIHCWVGRFEMVLEKMMGRCGYKVVEWMLVACGWEGMALWD